MGNFNEITVREGDQLSINEVVCADTNNATKVLINKEVLKALRQFAKPNEKRSWKLQWIQDRLTKCPFLPKQHYAILRIVGPKIEKSLEGFGEGLTIQIASIKAFAEAYERLIYSSVKERFQNSNGFAAHTSLLSASLNAFFEMLERDVILHCWFHRTKPLYEFDLKSTALPRTKSRRYGFNIRFFSLPIYWDLSAPCYVVLAVAYPLERGWVQRKLFPTHYQGRLCGFGCSLSIFEAVRKAYRECALLAWAYYMDPNLFASTTGEKYYQHSYLNPENTAAFDFLERAKLISYESSENPSASVEEKIDFVRNFMELNNISVKWHILADPSTDNTPFYVVKADSNQFQELWFGNSDAIKQSSEWLRKIPREILKNLPPHPIL